MVSTVLIIDNTLLPYMCIVIVTRSYSTLMHRRYRALILYARGEARHERVGCTSLPQLQYVFMAIGTQALLTLVWLSQMIVVRGDVKSHRC